MQNNSKMQEVFSAFELSKQVVFYERYGSGHINETSRLVCEDGREYILQKINTRVFQNVENLMENIYAVSRHVMGKVTDPRAALTIVNTKTGCSFHKDNSSGCWRVYDFVTDSLCLEQAETENDFYESGVGFGGFQKMLSDFPAATLHETIKNFHNTPVRYENFKNAVALDPFGRAKGVRDEIAFALEREEYAKTLQALLASKQLPLKVTHNDTKLNNVLLDAKTRKALCVIDLDTVMPGLAAYDFGDSIRFGAATAKEDEPDLSKVAFSLDLYKSYARGFLSAGGGSLTKQEKTSLATGSVIMTLECGVRFLTDYLEGDNYFRTSYKEHNLVRCRTQFKLVGDMEKSFDKMASFVEGG